MLVQLLTHTPDPERVVAAAARLCYSDASIDDLMGREKAEQEKLLRDHYIAAMVDEQITERDIKRLYNERYLNSEALQEVHLWQILVLQCTHQYVR